MFLQVADDGTLRTPLVALKNLPENVEVALHATSIHRIVQECCSATHIAVCLLQLETPMSRLQGKATKAPQKKPQHRRDLPEVDKVEIKVTIRPDQELKAERLLQVNEDTAEIRIIYYYDTLDLDLFEAGLVLRARLVKGDDDDSTVKIRPVKPGKILESWRGTKGFKVEADCVGRRIVCSASLTTIQKRDEIEEVAKGKRPIDKLFSKEQERFIGEFYKGSIEPSALYALGPIRVLCWELEQEGFAHKLKLEEWRLPDGDDLVEVSIKTAPEDAAQAAKEFDQHLRALGLDPEGAQETKTRTALNYFAKALRKGAR